MMKGLEIAKAFYFEWGKPYLEESFPDLAKRVAVGRISGSDVLGGDDEISKDHNWGPQFTIFLSAEDYAAHAETLSAEINAAAPNPWRGYKLDGGGDKSVNVECIPNLFKTWFGFGKLPQNNDAWKAVVQKGVDGGIHYGRESSLYFLRHGAIWFDGSGELTAWRKALHTYPQTIWRTRLAEEIFRVWHHGEYNFVQRVAKRHDPLAKAICIGEFVNGVMRTYLLLNQDFTPYWKWLAHEFRKLDEAQTVALQLDELVTTDSLDRQIELVLQISSDIFDRMKEEGIIYESKELKNLLPLLNAHIQLSQ